MRNGLFFLLFFISPFVIGEEISFLGTDIRFDVPIMMQYSKALNTWISSDLDMVLTDSRVDVAYAEIISQIDNQPDFEILAHTNTSSSLKKNDPINGFFTLMYISGTNEYTNIINVATIEKNYNLARDMIINAQHQELDKNEINERMFFKIELNPEWSLRGWIRSDYIYTIDNHATAFADPVLKLGCNKMIWPVEGNERKIAKYYCDPNNINTVTQVIYDGKLDTLGMNNYQLIYTYQDGNKTIYKYFTIFFASGIVYYIGMDTSNDRLNEYQSYAENMFIK